jgi:hypothetical protein
MASAKVQVANVLLAAWIQEQYPELFASLAAHASASPGGGLSGITDILSSIGSTIGNAATSVLSGVSTVAKSVGGFLSSSEGQQTLATLAAAKLQANQNSILQTQIARTQAGTAPAAIGTTYNPATGTYVPTMTTTTGQQIPLTQQALQSLQPSFIDKYGIWLLGGGLGLLVLIPILMRGRN